MDGQDIRMARKEAGLSAKELAERIGVSDATIYGWENDKWHPAKDKKTALRKLLFDGSVTPSEEMQREKDLSADDSTEPAEDKEQEEKKENSDEQAREKQEDDSEPDEKMCDDCECNTESDDADEHDIPEDKRLQVLNRGVKIGLQHAMLQAKHESKNCFWNGNMEGAVQLKRLHSVLADRIYNILSEQSEV